MRIVHLSNDYPDPLNPNKTQVIRSLVSLTGDQFDHQVFSLNRATPHWPDFVRSKLFGKGVSIRSAPFEQGWAVEYAAPGKGIFHASTLHRLGDWLADQISAGQVPDLIVGHKLTIEGIVARRVAQRLQVPFAISVQGNTDSRILRYRPDLHRELSAVFHGAQIVFPFTPWAMADAQAALGKRMGASQLLPCPTDLDAPLDPQAGDGGLLSAFHLKNHKLKNLVGMVRAVQLLADEGKEISLSVAGGGEPDVEARCQAIAGRAPQVRLLGPMGRQEVRRAMNRASGFVLPSHSESFGLVFIEALFAGTPVIYPEGRAIDGYFEDLPFAVKVQPGSHSSIARAMRHLIENEIRLKTELARWQKSDHAQSFMRSQIASRFAQGLKQAGSGGTA